MSLYLDASVIVALFVDDPFAARADKLVRSNKPDVIVSDFAAAEFASSLARHVRIGMVTKKEAADAFADFDVWRVSAVKAEIDSSDIQAAEAFLRRLDLTLRTPDALHIASARRLGAELATFDAAMAKSARALGVMVAKV